LLAHAKLRNVEAAHKGRSANASQSHIGQLYEEFALDWRLAHELAALRELSASEQIPPFIELVRRFPESTATAIGLIRFASCGAI
jgi:hypothetical protein